MIIEKLELDDGRTLWYVDTVEDADMLISLGLDIEELESTQQIEDITRDTFHLAEVNNPLVNIPFKSSLDMVQGVGSVTVVSDTGNRSYIDRYGIMRYAGINEPRFEKEGLLIQGAGTNLMSNSETYSNWLVNPVVQLVSSTETSPDLLSNAGKFVWDNGVKSSQSLGVGAGVVAVLGETFTQTIFIKPDGFTWVRVQRSLGDGTSAILFVDLINGVIGNESQCIGTAKKIYGGFVKITFTYTVLASGSERVSIYQADGNNDYATTGDGIKGYTVFGSQLEKNDFATSYIKTTTTQVTRAKEVVSMDFINNIPAIDDNYVIVADIDTRNSANAYIFRVEGESVRNALIVNNAALHSNFGTATDIKVNIDFTKTVRCVSRLNDLNINSGTEGELTLDNAIGDSPTGLGTSIFIGCFSSASTSGALNGHIKNFKIYEGLSDEEIRSA